MSKSKSKSRSKTKTSAAQHDNSKRSTSSVNLTNMKADERQQIAMMILQGDQNIQIVKQSTERPRQSPCFQLQFPAAESNGLLNSMVEVNRSVPFGQSKSTLISPLVNDRRRNDKLQTSKIKIDTTSSLASNEESQTYQGGNTVTHMT